jgi:hypothetical protein
VRFENEIEVIVSQSEIVENEIYKNYPLVLKVALIICILCPRVANRGNASPLSASLYQVFRFFADLRYFTARGQSLM